MTSNTYVTGGIAISDKLTVGALVRQFAKTQLPGAGHLEAAVERRNGRLTVTHAEAFPLTDNSIDVRVALEKYLTPSQS